ncbi:hypothetical protein [Zavarzinella formosa]|uniref:hypothetical protein n=1 Tax=Zavarzinella formosa TaxID=360055 RepID=UPI0002FDF3F6|nr:hypothetical protein [Zavarzinella formosa]
MVYSSINISFVLLTLFSHRTVDRDFSLSSSVVAAFSDGPVVIQSQIKYLGSRSISILWNSDLPNITVSMPENHPANFRIIGLNGNGASREINLEPGAILTEFECLHHRHAAFGVGNENTRIFCKILQMRDGRQEQISSLKLTINLNTVALNARGIARFESYYLNQLNKFSNSNIERRRIGQWLDQVSNFAFLGLMLNCLGSSHSRAEDCDWLNRIATMRCDQNVLSRILAEHLSANQTAIPQIFELWRSSKLPAPSQHDIIKLRTAKNIWIRTFATLIFDSSTNNPNIQKVASDLQYAYANDESSSIKQHIKRTDDNNYVSREHASKALLMLGEYAEMPIRSALSTTLSAESTSRLKNLLKLIEGEGCSEASVSVRCLEAINSQECRLLLNELAKSDFQNRMTFAARKAVAAREK